MPIFRGSTGAGVVRLTARTEGGERFARFIRRVNDDDLVMRLITESMRRRMLPRLRSQVPERTGRLRQSLRLRQRGRGVELQGTDYAPFVRWRGPSRQTLSVRRTARRILQDEQRAIGRDVIKALQA